MVPAMSTSTDVPPAVRTALSRLIDYAGLFPPAQLAMSPALEEYVGSLGDAHAWMLGRFIVPASRLDEFDVSPAAHDHECSVIVDAARGPREWFASAQKIFDRLHGRKNVACLEVPLPPLLSQRETYEATIGQVAMLAEKAGLRNRPVYIEIPRDDRFVESLPSTMSALARYGLGAKVRCGGIDAAAFPSVEEVRAFVRASANDDVPFKATAGLHHPIRHIDAATGFHMHGFLNILVAAVLAHRIDDATLEAILADEESSSFRFDETSLRWKDLRAADEEIAAGREHRFVAYGSCSFAEPVADLTELKILPQ